MSPYVVKKRKIRDGSGQGAGGFNWRDSRRRGALLRSWKFILVILALLLGAPVVFFLRTNRVIPEYTGQETEWFRQWRPLFKGIEYTLGVLETPRPLRIHALRVDLDDPEIAIAVTVPNSPQDPGEVFSRTTSSFLEFSNCQVAVNATIFEPDSKLSGKPVDILGFSMTQGKKYSPEASNLHAIGFTRDKEVHYATPSFDESADEIFNGVGGLWMAMQDGVIETSDYDTKLDPRTLVGSSADGRYLFLVVIDGRQPGYSEGVNTREAAELMQQLGAWNILNLDGGGSTTMVVENSFGRGVVVNRPCSPVIPGIQRPVANHLGIYAKDL
jgi:hypothetical protein